MNIVLQILKVFSGFCLLIFFFFGVSGFLKYSNEHSKSSKFFAYFAKHGTFAAFVFCIISLVVMVFIFVVMPQPLDNKERETLKEEYYEQGYDDGNYGAYDEGYDEGYGEGVEDGKAQCLDSLWEELAAYEDVSHCVVFVTSDGLFHHHTCDLLGDDYLDNAYDIPHALSCGFKPCEECISDYDLP